MGVEMMCAACRQTLPPAPSIFDGLRLSPMQRRIAELVLRAGEHGISGNRLFELVYAGDPDGGPLSGLASLRVQVRYANRKLGQIGKEVRAPKGGRGHPGEQHYVLRDIGSPSTWREMWSRPFAHPERI